MNQRCFICNNPIKDFVQSHDNGWSCQYPCPCCGFVWLSRKSADFIFSDNRIQEQEKAIISICLRDRYEKQGRKSFNKRLSIDDLQTMVNTYTPLDFLTRIEKFLLSLNKAIQSTDHGVSVNLAVDYSLYHCLSLYELISLLGFLHKEELIDTKEGESLGSILERGITQKTFDDTYTIVLTTKGLKRLKEMAGNDRADRFMEQAALQIEALRSEIEKKDALLAGCRAEARQAQEEIKNLKQARDRAEAAKEKAWIERDAARAEKQAADTEKQEALNIAKSATAAKKVALELVKAARAEREKALVDAKESRAEMKKTATVAEMAMTNARIAQEEMERLKAEAEKQAAEKLEVSARDRHAVKARNDAEAEGARAILEKETALDQLEIAMAEKMTAMSIAEKAKLEKQRAIETLHAIEAEVREAGQMITKAESEKARALKDGALAAAEAKMARMMAERAFAAVEKAEDEKKQAQAALTASGETVMDLEYKLDQALQAVYKAELDKKEALKLAYG